LLLLFVVCISNSACLLPVTAEDEGDKSRRAAPMIVLRSIETTMADFSNTAKTGLTRSDFRGITQMLQGKATIVPIRTFVSDAGRGERSTSASITGTTGEFAKVSSLRVTEGRFLSHADATKRNNVAVLDSATAKALVPDGNPVGHTLRVGKQAFVVVGVCEKTAAKAGPTIYIPITTMWSRFGDLNIRRASGTFEAFRYELSEIRISLEDSMHLETVTKAVKKLLADSHELEDYSIEINP
jgi:putative ABC transport system permease protein